MAPPGRAGQAGGMPDPTTIFDPSQASLLSTPVGTIRYWQRYPGGYGESRTAKDGNAGTSHFWVAWPDVEDFRRYAMGYTRGPATPGASTFDGYTFRRTLPLFWPRGRRVMRCDAVDEVGFANDGGYAHYPDPAAAGWFRTDFVELACGFTERHLVVSRTDYDLRQFFTTYPNYPISELPRYVERRWRTVPKERKIPGKGYETYDPLDLPAEGTPVLEVGFVPYTETEWVYTWHQVPVEWYPKDAIQALYLRVNETPSPDPGAPWNKFDRKFPPGTLRFNGLAGELAPYSGPDENLYVDVAYSFSEQPQGWNRVPSIDPALSWRPIRRMTAAGVGSNPPIPLYASGDLNRLFRPNPTILDEY